MSNLFRLMVALALFAVTAPAWLADSVVAQETDKNKREVLDRVHRARRLRDFGYPLLARAQLDLARKLDPNSREMLIEYVRLYTKSEARLEETTPYVASLLELFPEDYEACFELGNFLYLSAEPPPPPNSNRPEQLKGAIERLDAEMKVYRELGAYLARPEGELPASAKGRPKLSLAYLARCLRKTPSSAEALYVGACDLYFRARTFQGWSLGDASLAAFGKAAEELYRLAEPLFRACTESADYGASSRIYVVELLVRLSRFQDAQREAVAAELANPGSLRVANAWGDIAESTRNLELLVTALRKRNAIYRNSETDFDIRVATRIQANNWPFTRWRQYVELEELSADARIAAVNLMLKEQPEFTELYFLQAVHSLLLARSSDQPVDARRWLDAAMLSLDKCKELATDFADWHRRRGLALWLLGRYEDAAAAYEETARLSPADRMSRAYAFAGRDIAKGNYTASDYEEYRALQQPGDFTEKKNALVAIVRRSPRFAAALMALAEVCQVLGDFELSYEAARKALDLSPDNADLVDTAAQSALRVQRYTDAAAHFEKMLALQPARLESRRMLNLAKDLSQAPENRRKAFVLWQQTQRPSESEPNRRKKLEEAMVLDGTFPEVLIDLAILERGPNPVRAERLLETALRHNRDEFTKAAAHRERGRLFVGARAFAKGVGEFESAYAAFRADGADLLLAALALTQIGQHADASAAMRRLFADLPNSPLLRPRDADLQKLGLAPQRSETARRLSPGYGAGDKATFVVELAVEGEGGGQAGRRLSLEFDVNFQVLETPENGGLWKLKVGFANPPTAEFAALTHISMELHISPWFGLVNEPGAVPLEEIVSPALQALCEAFTCGMGDAPVAPPWVWRNTLTKGPAHFGTDDAFEASCVSQALGDNIEILRRAAAGRELGEDEEGEQTELTYTRGLRAVTQLAGAKRAVLMVGFEIAKQELTRERDDVVKSRLQVMLKAK